MFSRERPLIGTTSLLTPLPTDPERSSRRFLHKNKGSSGERSSPLRLKHASKEARPEPPFLRSSGRMTMISRSPPKLWQHPRLQMDFDKKREAAVSNNNGTSKTHKTVMISHHVHVLRRRDLTLEESDSSVEPRKHPIIFFYCSLHRRILRHKASASEHTEACKT